MPRFPCRGPGTEDGIFHRPFAQRDEGVHTTRIGFKHVPGLMVEQREMAARSTNGVELPSQHIAGQRGFADPLRVPPATPAQQRFHLPETILRMGEATPGKGIEMRGRANMWNAPCVAS